MTPTEGIFFLKSLRTDSLQIVIHRVALNECFLSEYLERLCLKDFIIGIAVFLNKG